MINKFDFFIINKYFKYEYHHIKIFIYLILEKNIINFYCYEYGNWESIYFIFCCIAKL